MKLALAENAYLFDPPIEYDWDMGVKYNYDNPELTETFANVILENGMEVKYSLTNPFPPIKSNSAQEIVDRGLQFDFAHAFGHLRKDPNYSYLHWAICGWFKDRYKGEINQEENYG